MIKIIIDLDVVTVAKWDKGVHGNESRNFMVRVEDNEFCLITPTLLIELVKRWKHEHLKTQIVEFYLKNSKELVERISIIGEIISKDINFEKLFNRFVNIGIKEEDITLILVSSLREALLITFNRIHLKNKEGKINEILSEYGIKTIRIISPGQI